MLRKKLRLDFKNITSMHFAGKIRKWLTGNTWQA